MRSLARNQRTQAANTVIADDIMTNEAGKVNEDTVHSYIGALKKIFVVEDMPAWNPNLRSKSAIRTTDTRYYVDSSIAVASLGIGPDDLLNDLKTFGLLFETMCVRDLRVFVESLGGSVYHYRDNTGLECDAVVHMRNGKYGLVEIKLGGDERTVLHDGAYGRGAVRVPPRGRGACRFDRSFEELTSFSRQARRLGMRRRYGRVGECHEKWFLLYSYLLGVRPCLNLPNIKYV